jgi:hypothetical protein
VREAMLRAVKGGFAGMAEWLVKQASTDDHEPRRVS